MKTPILGSSYVAATPNAAANRMVNMYPEAIPEGGKMPAFLTRCPGLRRVLTVGTGPCRGMRVVGGYLYVVSGNVLYKVAKDYSFKLIGSIIGQGLYSLSDNGSQLFISCNPNGYIYDIASDVLTKITDEDFPGSSVVDYLDGFFIVLEPNSQKFYISSIYDGLTWDSLDFASAEGLPDDLVTLCVDHRELWLFGTESIEVYTNSGDSFPFSRIPGVFIEKGCGARYSVAKLDNSIFWLSYSKKEKGIVYRADGYTPVRISNHYIESQIEQFKTIEDAQAYTYTQAGHAFYVLTFPKENRTFAFDASTNSWHERASFENGKLIRHRSSYQENFNLKHHVGDFKTGNIYVLDKNYFSEYNDVQKCIRSWRALPTGQTNYLKTTHHSLAIDIETGWGINSTYLINYSENLDFDSNVDYSDYMTEESKLSLRWSDDSGKTWSNYHEKSLGKLGDFKKRVIFHRLGMTKKLRDRIYEISITDPIPFNIMGAELIITQTAS
jgi:hypothetical protein